MKADAFLAAREPVREAMDEKVSATSSSSCRPPAARRTRAWATLSLIGFGASPRDPAWPSPARPRLHGPPRPALPRHPGRRHGRPAAPHRPHVRGGAEDIRQEQIVTEILDQVRFPEHEALSDPPCPARGIARPGSEQLIFSGEYHSAFKGRGSLQRGRGLPARTKFGPTGT